MKDLVGEMRPSQLLFTQGVGALIDLPYMTVLPLGLDDWDAPRLETIHEERLKAAVRLRLPRVERLCAPPSEVEDGGSEDDERGVPTVPFPRWLVCSACRTLAPISMDLFRLKVDVFRPDQSGFEHTYCQRGRQSKPPRAFPARFLVACRRGHLDDFPWVLYVHDGPSTCGGLLRLVELGVSGEAREVVVTCQQCGANRPMAQAFERRRDAKQPSEQTSLAVCRGRRIHLRDHEAKPCDEEPRAMLIGASNLWFPCTLSVLALPEAGSDVDQTVGELWADYLAPVTAKEMLPMLLTMPPFRKLLRFGVDQIWAAVERKRGADAPDTEARDLKHPEWRLFSDPAAAPSSDDFALTEEKVPAGFEPHIERVVLAERLREVQALTGFTRVEPKMDPLEGDDSRDVPIVPLSRTDPRWVPASESRGEGIFIQLREDAVESWLALPGVRDASRTLLTAHSEWRRKRGIAPAAGGFQGMRLVLVHSLAHALVRQLTLDCGYSAASLKERLYVRDPGEPGGPMAGFLIYTAASDSEGTLGGLSSQGTPEALGTHLHGALEQAGLCSSDPLCCEMTPDRDGRSLNGASCHACLLSPETFCERGNRYLDRSTLVTTTAGPAMAFFP